MSRMRIAMLTPFPSPDSGGSGALIYVSSLSKAIARTPALELRVITLGNHASRGVSDGVDYRVVMNMRWCRYVPVLPALIIASEVRRRRPDILHFQGTTFSPYTVFGLFLSPSKTPKVMTILGHAIEEMVVRGQIRENSIQWKVQSWVDRAVVRKFDRIVCVTSKMKNELIAKYGHEVESKIVVIPSGIDTTRYGRKAAAPSIALPPPLDSDASPVVVTAKSLYPWNGQEYLIRAFPDIIARWPSAKLVLVGDGPDMEHLKSLVGELSLTSSVFLLGKLPNEIMPAIISRADIVVIPSARIGGVEEGSSILLLEGMASSKPVIASDVGGNSEAIVDGKTGILVPEKDPAAISRSLSRLIENPATARSIGAAASEYVINSRTWDSVAQMYHSLYSELTVRSK